MLDVRKNKGPIDVVVDSTGMKVFGEGEQKCDYKVKSLINSPTSDYLSSSGVSRQGPAEFS